VYADKDVLFVLYPKFLSLSVSNVWNENLADLSELFRFGFETDNPPFKVSDDNSIKEFRPIPFPK